MSEPKKKYEPPQIISLTGSSVEGQGTEGICFPGISPYTVTCAVGDDPPQTPGQCNPTGLNETIGECDAGNGASRDCIVGSTN